MASITQTWKMAEANVPLERLDSYQAIYGQNRHRVYALAFWMTDNEMAAEELAGSVFQRAFALSASPSPETIDRVLLAELRRFAPIGNLTLRCDETAEILNVRRNLLRVHLERAVVQLPPTERLIFLFHDVENYSHARIARLLGLSVQEAQFGLHQARIRVRELVARMR